MDSEHVPDVSAYQRLLAAYLEEPCEACLLAGYDLARQMLADGSGIHELVDAHQMSLQIIFCTSGITTERLARSAEFLRDCLTPFEMSHRGAAEGTRALLHVNEVLELELKRVAQALHDEASQALVSADLALFDIASALPLAARHSLEAVSAQLRGIECILRDLSHQLRPPALDDLGLVLSLELLADQISRRTGLIVIVHGNVSGRLPSAVEIALYRVVQEALTNVVRHAHAKSAYVSIHESPVNFVCSIQDDGVGFGASLENVHVNGLGLRGILERVRALGGTLRLRSREAGLPGAELTAEVPRVTFRALASCDLK